jgi:hypothetical protein
LRWSRIEGSIGGGIRQKVREKSRGMGDLREWETVRLHRQGSLRASSGEQFVTQGWTFEAMFREIVSTAMTRRTGASY